MAGGPLQKQSSFSLRFSLVEVEKSTENSGFSDKILNKKLHFYLVCTTFCQGNPYDVFFLKSPNPAYVTPSQVISSKITKCLRKHLTK